MGRNIGACNYHWLLRSHDQGIIVPGLTPQDAKREAAKLGVRLGPHTWCLPIPEHQMRQIDTKFIGCRILASDAANIENMEVSAPEVPLPPIPQRVRKGYGPRLDRIIRLWARMRLARIRVRAEWHYRFHTGRSVQGLPYAPKYCPQCRRGWPGPFEPERPLLGRRSMRIIRNKIVRNLPSLRMLH